MKIITFLLMLFSITAAYSQNTWTNGNGTGVWSDDLNWSNGAIPDGFEAVIFDGASTTDDCFIDVDPGMSGVAFSMLSTYTGTITVSDGVTFEVGLMTIQAGTFIMGDGPFSSAGFNMSGSVTREFDGTNASQITISGNLNIGSSLSTFRAAANTINGTTLIGTFGGTGTFVHNSGKFRFSASTTRAVPNGVTFYQLELFNSISGVVQFTFGTSVSVTNLLIISGNSSASNISFATGTINLSGNLDVSSFSSSTAGGTLTGTINFTGTGVQSITGTSTAGAAKLPNITINKSGGSLSLGSDNISIAGNFTYTAGTVNANTSTVYFFGTKNINSSGVVFNNVTIGHTSLAAASTLTSAMYAAGNLNIASGSTLATGGMGLRIEGDATNLGTFTPGSSTITLSGSNSQAIDLRNNSTVTINTLVINKGTGTTATINDTIIISDLLTSTAGTLNANNKVQLQSTASKTAQVGPVTGTLTGNFIVQRFIASSTTPKWRFIAAPVSSASNATIRNNWQSSMFVTGAGTGTGPVGLQNYNSNGFDWTLSNSSSMYTYIENQTTDFNGRWTALGGPVATSLSSGTGYRAYVRGDRSASGRLDGTVTTQNAVTLNVTGNLVTGNQTLNTTCSNGCTLNDGWNLLGNPFAATIDWQSVTRNNVDATVYVYNPLLNLYCTFTSGGSGTNGGSRYISSGQGFFVKCSSTGGGSVVIEEVDKSPSNANDMYKTTSTANELRVFLNNAANTVKDEMLTGFNPSATKLYDGETDAYKMGGGFGSISSTTAQLSTLLAVNKISTSADFSTDTVIVKVNLNGNAQTYSLNFSGVSSFEEGTSVYLYDNFLNTTVNLATTPVYTFTTLADTNSYGKRFLLLFGHLLPLPVSFKSFDAEQAGKDVDVKWTTSKEYELDGFDIEHCNNGVDFTVLGYVKATGTPATETSYSFADGQPLNGANYYRLKYISKNGNTNYSNIVQVDFTTPTGLKETAAKTKVNAYPVPATDELNLNFTEAIKGDVKVNIYDPFGSLISSRIATVGSANELKQDISVLESGVYFMQIKTGNGFNTQVKFIKD